MPFPAVKCCVFMGIIGEYDSSCTGEGMPSPYNGICKLTDKSEFVRIRELLMEGQVAPYGVIRY